MASQRIQRRIDALLDAADEGVAQRDWALVRESAQAALRLDPENADALTFLTAAERDGQGSAVPATLHSSAPLVSTSTIQQTAVQPTCFASGRYEVRRFLGEGGKKKVYLAHDTRLGRDVAFALIKTEGLDDEGLARVLREAQAMGQLGDHPHIVGVFDMGEEMGQPYLVTQLMSGGDVEGLIEKAPDHRLPLKKVLQMADQVCRALEYAHAHGIVHRDLKPGNVWLTADGTAKLGDFGLAVALDRSRLTRAGMMVGTVSYMPPEQAMGGTVEFRSDLYSLGAMLYEMATGRPPFVGDESVAIITQHLLTPPVAPSWHRPDLPPSLEALILRLLEKDPAQRPSCAEEVRRALAAIDLKVETTASLGSSAPVASASGGEDPIYRETFVGREAALSQLQTAFESALAGQGSLVVVSGEPGIGKTALCEQLATHVAVCGGRVLTGHCYEESSLSLPYLPFVEALRSYVLARPPEVLREELGTGAADVARIVSEVREKMALPEVSSPGDPEEERWRLFQAVTGFLRSASSMQPLLLVLEDLHWADQGTLDLLTHAARQLGGARLLVIGTYRDTEVDRAHPLAGALATLRRVKGFGSLMLRGLSPDEVQRMVANIATEEVPRGLVEAVERQTEGNPLFIQEVLRYLVEEGLITRDWKEGRWRATGTTPLEMSIPQGLRDVIGRRLSRLSPECNRLLSAGAVIGREFSLETLQGVAGLPEDAVLERLEEAVRTAVLQEQAKPGGVTYRFINAFFRQTLYEELIAPRRIRLHQQVAHALEKQYGARPGDHAAQLLEHFSFSSDPVDLAKAVEYGEVAAGRASEVFAYGEAARLLEQVVQVHEILASEDKRRRCDLLLAFGEALLGAGEPRRGAEEAAPSAFLLAEASGDAGRANRAIKMAVIGLVRAGGAQALGSPAFRKWSERADRYAAPETADRVRADIALAAVRRGAGLETEAKMFQDRALELAHRLDDPEALFFVAWLMEAW